MTRILAAGLAALALAPAAFAQAQYARVLVVPPFSLEEYADRGAVGLLVPGAGPEITREDALAALVRGRVQHSLLDGEPAGEPLIELGGSARRATIYVSLPARGEHANDRRYPIAVVGAGYRGLLVSDSTRIAGLVSIVDVAPTALRTQAALEWQPDAGAAAALTDLDERIDEKNAARLPASLVTAAVLALLALFRPRSVVLGFSLALAANLVLGLVAAPAWLMVGAIAVAAAAAPFLARVPLAAAIGTVVLAYLLSLAADTSIVALSPFGPSQSGRFYGISNLIETLMLVPAFAGVALLARRPLVAAGLAAVTLVSVAGSRFGADGGGAIVLVAGFLVLAARLSDVALTPRRLALAGGAALMLALAFVGLDAATGGSSHVTESLGSGGLPGDLGDRLELSARRAVSSWGAALIVVAGLGFLVHCGMRRPRFPVTDALLVAVAVSLLVNDTPSDVAGFGALACGAVWRWERVRRQDDGV